MKIIIPELENPTIKEAIQTFPEVEFLPADSLEQATTILIDGQADSMLSGLDYSSRDVLLAYKAAIPVKSRYFSSCFICSSMLLWLPVVAERRSVRAFSASAMMAAIVLTASTG